MKQLIILLSIITVLLTSSVSFGQSSEKLRTIQQKKTLPQSSTEKAIYTCTMHPEVIKDKPGKCPKCRMDLVKKESKKILYTCPHHPEIKQDKPGTCPKCGMDLIKNDTPKEVPKNKFPNS